MCLVCVQSEPKQPLGRLTKSRASREVVVGLFTDVVNMLFVVFAHRCATDSKISRMEVLPIMESVSTSVSVCSFRTHGTSISDRFPKRGPCLLWRFEAMVADNPTAKYSCQSCKSKKVYLQRLEPVRRSIVAAAGQMFSNLHQYHH